MPIIRVAVAGALALLVTVSALVTSRADRTHHGFGAPLTVMTRNVFLGTNIFPVFDAATAPEARRRQVDVTAHAMHEARDNVDKTAYRVRARLIAGEIAAAEPDLVGLQEVALWRSGPLETRRVGVPNATAVDLDFLEILLADLTATGHRYRVVNQISEMDMEFASYGSRGRAGARDVRLTLRDVVLMRQGDDLTVVDRGRGHFTARRTMHLPGRVVDFTRGHAWVDVERAGHRFRFIATHLEVGDPRVSNNQVRELVTGPAATHGPVVVVCDCNTDPDAGRRSMPYRAITGAGFADAWHRLPEAGPGHTCCTTSGLRDTRPGVMDHRLDFVFVRARRGFTITQGAVLGGTTDDRDTATGLWPSDHAGLVVTVRDR
ncbi:exonuclease/endonuclease/phosphatase family protein [Nocardioides jensenii]|uniref:hypothetical protein n=1 Tax=Nocardioides jensenii TaxID=1843 RepID=UPI000836688B|nr:hypothetical protein [Nocardioides jensenii]